MLNKLMKYDMLFGLKRYGMLFLLLGCTWLTGLVVKLIGNDYLNMFFLGINVLVSIVFYAAYIITSIQFFYRALSSEESYLNYTIPVSPLSLIFSKMATVLIWGAATGGALVLTWVMYFKMFAIELPALPDGFMDMMIWITVATSVLSLCLLAFAVAIFNTPLLKSFRAGMILVAVAAYLLSQVVGVIQVVVMGVCMYIGEKDLFRMLFSNQLTSGEEMALMDSLMDYMTWPLVVTSIVFSLLFFWLTVRMVGKRRSI